MKNTPMISGRWFTLSKLRYALIRSPHKKTYARFGGGISVGISVCEFRATHLSHMGANISPGFDIVKEKSLEVPVNDIYGQAFQRLALRSHRQLIQSIQCLVNIFLGFID